MLQQLLTNSLVTETIIIVIIIIIIDPVDDVPDGEGYSNHKCSNHNNKSHNHQSLGVLIGTSHNKCLQQAVKPTPGHKCTSPLTAIVKQKATKARGQQKQQASDDNMKRTISGRLYWAA